RLRRRRLYLRGRRGLRGEESCRGERRRPNDMSDVEHRAILPCEPWRSRRAWRGGKSATDQGYAATPGRAKGERNNTGRVDRSAWRHDQASRGHHDPAAVLLADCVYTSETRHDIARINLDEPHAAFEQRSPAMDVAQHPSFDCPGLARLGW